QLAIIRRMNLDLDHGVRIVALPTIREHDGLALSSRNRRLTAADRTAAVCLWHALRAATRLVSAGERSAAMIEAAVVAAVAAEPSARLEYAAVVHPESFELIQSVGSEALIVVAAWFGDVRLIDNVVVSA
ncbi:MAG: pantoate--beta-alanine ligase, partial [Acidimicrobiaceae bacterium]